MKKSSKRRKFNEIRDKSAQIIIGKNGLTENILTTIKKQLNKDKIIKIKILKAVSELKSMGRKDFAEIIAKKLNANLIEIRGYNLILEKKRSTKL
ncbi:MAG: YhbY family RNA-binding protein [Candidatus Helarchaeota archaeon]|nr:YhbY family RNA-binding protein [Candidatus Helarchaeota archaeon]